MEERIVLPVDHFRKRVKNQYGSPYEPIVREVLQNSIDAYSRNVWFRTMPDGWEAEDDGLSMSLPDFREFFLVLGGTKKDTGSIGGFGAAKEVLALAWEEWWCEGKDFRVDGRGAASPKSIAIPGHRDLGFVIGAKDGEFFGNSCMIENAVKSVCSLSSFKQHFRVWLNGEQVPTFTGHTSVIDERPWGTFSGLQTDSDLVPDGYAAIRHHGLWSCNQYIGADRKYIIDLSPTAKPQDVFNEARSAMKWSIQADLNSKARQYSEMVGVGTRPTISIIHGTGGGWTVDPNTGYRISERDGETVKDVISRYCGDKNSVVEKKTRLPFNFLLFSDEGEAEMKEEYVPVLRTINEVVMAAADVFHRPAPLVGLVLRKDEKVESQSVLVGFNRCIAMDPHAMVRGGPYRFLSVIAHEMAHDRQDYHGIEFLQEICKLMEDAGPEYAELMRISASAWKTYGLG